MHDNIDSHNKNEGFIVLESWTHNRKLSLKKETPFSNKDNDTTKKHNYIYKTRHNNTNALNTRNTDNNKHNKAK